MSTRKTRRLTLLERVERFDGTKVTAWFIFVVGTALIICCGYTALVTQGEGRRPSWATTPTVTGMQRLVTCVREAVTPPCRVPNGPDGTTVVYLSDGCTTLGRTVYCVQPTVTP